MAKKSMKQAAIDETIRADDEDNLTPGQRALRWTLIIGVILALCYVFRSILTPYIIGIALAYFLDPVADWLERHGFKRIIAVTIITLVAAGVIILILVVAVPLAFDQLSQLIQGFPDFFAKVNGVLTEKFPQLTGIEQGVVERVNASSEQIAGKISNWVLNSTASLFGWIGAIFIVPIVGFYLLYDWDRMSKVVDSWVPRDYLATYRYLSMEIDKTLSGFVRGQGTVCLVMAAYYSLTLTFLGLKFGFIIGIIAGITTAIPMIGGLFGGILVVGVGFFQYVIGQNDWGYYILVLVVYFAGQAFEGNFFTPRLVGNSVGLHPVWVMFALSAGALVGGFGGMVVAVPVAAVIGVIGRYLMAVYKRGPLYLGEDFDDAKYKAEKEKARAGQA